MNQQADDKELMAAFAEFKEMLRRDSEPPGVSTAPEVRLAPETNAALIGDVALRSAPSFGAAKFEPADFAPPPIAPSLSARDEWTQPPPDVAPPALEPETAGDRRKLLYLSFAIVVMGLSALGWTLVNGRQPIEDLSIADVDPSAELEAALPASEQATLEDPAAPPPIEGDAPAEQAELTPPAAEAPAPVASALEAPPAAEAAVPPPPAPVTPSSSERAPVTGDLKPTAAPAPVAVAPVVSAGAGAVAPIAAAPTGAVSKLAPPSAAPATASLQPANRFIAPEPETPAAEPAKPEPKPAAPAKAAKPKSKPAQAAKTRSKPRNAAPDDAPTFQAVAAPEPAPPPPPPVTAPQSDGAFGFVKRTFNSVGSTIGGIGRAVVP